MSNDSDARTRQIYAQLKAGERIPFGPLTRTDFFRLAGSFNDSEQVGTQIVARKRGILPGDYFRVVVEELNSDSRQQRVAAAIGSFSTWGTDSISFPGLHRAGLCLGGSKEGIFKGDPTEIQSLLEGPDKIMIIDNHPPELLDIDIGGLLEG